MHEHDAIIIGGGILGLASAWTLSKRHPDWNILVLEKENRLATHQTGRNSGVLHAGIYYLPGSMKATLTRRGKDLMESLASERGIPFERCGKLVIATDEQECSRLDTLHERSTANGVNCRMVGPEEAAELEPHARVMKALHVMDTGIIDYSLVCSTLAEDITANGGEIRTSTRVSGLRRDGKKAVVQAGQVEARTSLLVNCGGLQSDRLARMSGTDPGARIIPFRGDYYQLRPEARHLCRNLIYPVPDPAFPFLGVHFTRMIDGGVECGPNAVLSLAREGYGRASFNFRDACDALAWPGLHRLVARHWRMGCAELLRSWSKSRFTRSLQRLVPDISEKDIMPAQAGNRAQALARNGDLVDDFLIQQEGPFVHVINAPSPAATASLAIAEIIADRAESALGTPPATLETAR